MISNESCDVWKHPMAAAMTATGSFSPSLMADAEARHHEARGSQGGWWLLMLEPDVGQGAFVHLCWSMVYRDLVSKRSLGQEILTGVYKAHGLVVSTAAAFVYEYHPLYTKFLGLDTWNTCCVVIPSRHKFVWSLCRSQDKSHASGQPGCFRQRRQAGSVQSAAHVCVEEYLCGWKSGVRRTYVKCVNGSISLLALKSFDFLFGRHFRQYPGSRSTNLPGQLARENSIEARRLTDSPVFVSNIGLRSLNLKLSLSDEVVSDL